MLTGNKRALANQVRTKHNLFNLNISNTDVSSSKEKLTDELANLLNETAEDHHKAATNGEDAEWPIWYANYLLDKLISFNILEKRYCIL